MNAAPARIDGLTIARGLAAWMVVLFHTRGAMPWLPSPVLATLAKGYLAVDFFFLLSGFVIYLSAHRAFLDEGFAAAPAFFRRRLARIYPLYALMLALTAAFAALLSVTGRNAGGYPWRELPLHVAMLQNWGFTSDLSWNHPAWSISTEMAAYLLFPLIVVATPIARMPRWALTVGIATAIAFMAAWLRIGGLTELGQDIPRFGLVRCLFEFTAGVMLCALWLKTRPEQRQCTSALAWATLIGASLSWSVDARQELWAFPAAAAALILLLADRSHSRVGSDHPTFALRLFVYLGEISYATYLSHFMLFIWFKIVLVDDPANISPAPMLLFLLLTLVVSILLYHGVERPGRRLGRRVPGSLNAIADRA